MSLTALCFKGPNRGKTLEMDSFVVVNTKGTNLYQARGESTKCGSILSRGVSKVFALDWEKSTGKKIEIVEANPKRKKENEEKKKRKALRREKKKEAEKAKKMKEKEKAKKMKDKKVSFE